MAAHELGQRPIGSPERIAGDEEHGQYDVARRLERSRQVRIDSQLFLRFLERRGQLSPRRRLPRQFVGRRGDRQAAGTLVDVGLAADIGQTGILLRFGKEDRRTDDLGTAGRQLVDHLGQHLARPRPATEIVEAVLVDGDHRDAIRRNALGLAQSHVVGRQFQRTPGPAVLQNEYGDTDD